MPDAIRVNDVGYSYGSLAFRLDGERYYGFTAISFGEKREFGVGYSMARHTAPTIRSSGMYSVELVKVTGWKHSVLALQKAIAAKSGGSSYGNYPFQGLLQYLEGDLEEITYEFDRLKWSSNAVSHDVSPDPLKQDFELHCMFIRKNGLTLFDSSEGMP